MVYSLHRGTRHHFIPHSLTTARDSASLSLMRGKVTPSLYQCEIDMSGKTTPATEIVSRAGVAFQLHEYKVSGQLNEGYGVGAAKALGVEPERVFKTLLVLVDGKTVGVAIIPAPALLNLKAAAAALGGKKAVLADPKVAEKATGYVVGGISPLGQKKRLKVAIDESVHNYKLVIVSAGRRGLMMELASSDLLTLTGASSSPLCR